MKTIKILPVILALSSASISAAEGKLDLPVLDGAFKPDWASLKQYQCPDWFRDAKFGIWAHWGPQCQPEQGDWYARNMYTEGSGQNKYHVATYGHPSKFGFKDICNLWKADKFDPDALMSLYKQAGAKYFVQMANHHCNFDNYDSTYQPWNSVKIGPKKDLVGLWAAAAKKYDVHFGVTVHAGRAWSWYEGAQGADTNGPMKGVPYDGKLTKADGKGLWWDGLDPQDLYAQNHAIGTKPDDAYCQKFYNRTKELIDKYQPDLLYFDDSVLPLGNRPEIGLSLAAHLYNSNAKAHGGRNDAVMNTKGLNEEQRQCLIWDIERGISDRIEPFVWQTDTCIGGWHYNRGIYDKHGYKTPATVIHLLADIVSKNGNLLLNVPVRGDGTIDEDETKCLEGIAAWMRLNSEAIFGTRPWKVYGEGYKSAKAGAGNFNEGKGNQYTAEDMRFTTKGDMLYAIVFGWPDSGKFVVKTLGKKQAGLKGDITSVELLGASTTAAFERTEAGLSVTLPQQKVGDCAWVLKIKGLDLAGSNPTEQMTIIPFFVKAGKDGGFKCNADDADLHGKKIRMQGHGSKANVSRWDDHGEYISWPLEVTKAGKFQVTVRTASQRTENAIVVEIGGQQLGGTAPKTSSWEEYTDVKLGQVEIKEPGKLTLTVRPAGEAKQWKAINLASVTLKAVK
ncbi:MAG: alpha-L-fucosidase [Verrucomicrobiota bacterium]